MSEENKDYHQEKRAELSEIAAFALKLCDTYSRISAVESNFLNLAMQQERMVANVNTGFANLSARISKLEEILVSSGLVPLKGPTLVQTNAVNNNSGSAETAQ